MDTLLTILFVLTNTAQIDSTHATGVWLEEFAVPRQVFVEAGAQVTVASPKGGNIPIDPRSLTDETRAKFGNEIVMLQSSQKLSTIKTDDYDAIFFPGGHGTMFDLPGNKDVEDALITMYQNGKIVSAVCHGPAAFVGAKMSNGKLLVEGRQLAVFTDSEEKAAKLDHLMPFLLESKLKEQGATVVAGPNFEKQVVVDGKIVTGQNPQSSEGVAQAVMELLKR